MDYVCVEPAIGIRVLDNGIFARHVVCWTMVYLPVMSCVGQWYFCRWCRVSNSLSRDCNIYKKILTVYICSQTTATCQQRPIL